MSFVNGSLINGNFVIDSLYYLNSPYHIPAYNHNHTIPAETVHPNSPAAQLGLTPWKLPRFYKSNANSCETSSHSHQPDLLHTTTTLHELNPHDHHSIPHSTCTHDQQLPNSDSPQP